ncbi:MAG: hydrogenase expression/formation protein HypE [Planctomycetes bacterium GWF2_41_51]|nr:MAG: hydrogenase expression/formation protein HypE [Planctomycetes bacterium GWF2_41_51]
MSGEIILLAHGGGGRLTDELIRNVILSAFGNFTLNKLTDSAELQIGQNAINFTTDGFVVKPLFFNGGDIGKLAICGTINDLAVSGSKPLALSMSLIIEEGLEVEVLRQLLNSAAKTAKEENVEIVCGDTKVVEAGAADKLFINTSGIGLKLPKADIGFERIIPGDKIIVSGTIGDHGMTIMSQREGMKFETEIQSDCGSVADICRNVIDGVGENIKFMRDPTRGGLAATLNEIVRETSCGIEIDEHLIPVNPSTIAAAEMLGFDILEIANEGKVVVVVSSEKADRCLEICKRSKNGKDAAIIGQVIKTDEPFVELITKIKGRRIVQMPYGRELPRIC